MKFSASPDNDTSNPVSKVVPDVDPVDPKDKTIAEQAETIEELSAENQELRSEIAALNA